MSLTTETAPRAEAQPRDAAEAAATAGAASARTSSS